MKPIPTLLILALIPLLPSGGRLFGRAAQNEANDGEMETTEENAERGNDMSEEKTVYIMDADFELLTDTCERTRRHLADARAYCRRVEHKRRMDRRVLALLGASAGLFGWACVMALLVG